MNEKLHIIITADSGKTLNLPFSKNKLYFYCLAGVALFAILSLTSAFTLSLYTNNRSISTRLASLDSSTKQQSGQLGEKLRLATEENAKLSELVERLKFEHANQTAALEEEKDQLLSTAVSELNERNEALQTIMDNIGIKIKEQKEPQPPNSGGPFILHQPIIHDELIFKADTYLETISYVPLGKPVFGRGTVTSRFGKRQDPVNGRKSFHEGIDLRGKRGENIYATADGVVAKAYKNGSYGNYVKIDHKNGYKTAFAHMKKYHVRKGDIVKRGQVIGQVGNSGRSTGPHLHYEIIYKGKPVNPLKYTQVSKLMVKSKTKEEKN